MNDIRELEIAELDDVCAGDEKPKDPLPKLPEDPVITVIKVLGGAQRQTASASGGWHVMLRPLRSPSGSLEEEQVRGRYNHRCIRFPHSPM